MRCQQTRSSERQGDTLLTSKRATLSPWASERSVSKTQQIGRGGTFSSAVSADQDGEETLSYFTGKKGYAVTKGIRKVSVQNSAD